MKLSPRALISTIGVSFCLGNVSAQAPVAPPVAPPVADPLTPFCEKAKVLPPGSIQQSAIADKPEGVWFSFLGTGGALTVTTCTGDSALDSSVADTSITLYSGSCNALNQVEYDNDGGCVLDRSLITFLSVACHTYYVQVTQNGFDPTFHPGLVFGLLLKDSVELISSATALQLGVVQESKIAEAPEGVWFSFLGTGGDLTVTTCSSVPALDNTFTDTIITVYSGSCNALSQVAYDDDGGTCGGGKSLVTLQSVACQKYYVKVTRYRFNSALHSGFKFGLVVRVDPVAAPISSPVASCPVANCPVAPPMACPVAAPVGTPITSPVAPPVAPPFTPPVLPPVTPPIALPVAPPVAPPFTPPVLPPVAPPVALPISPPVDPPVTPPIALPVAPPFAPPFTPPVLPPVAPPISPPVSPPVTPPIAPPIDPPIDPPVAPSVTTPVALNPVAGSPVVSVDAPIKATVATPTTGGDTTIVHVIIAALLSFLGAAAAIMFCIW